MQLNNFALLKEDDETYHVKHPTGKMLILKKGGLSKQAHEAIKALKPQKLAEGTADLKPVAIDPSSITNDELNNFNSVNEIALARDNAGSAAAQGMADTLRAGAPTELPPEAPLAPTGQAAGASVQAGATGAPPQSSDPLIQQKLDTEGLLTQQEGNVKASAAAEAAAEKGISKAYKNYGDQVALLPTPNEIAAKYKDSDDKLLQAYTNKTLDPDRYWNNMSTGSKVVSSIGMLLSGIGSATTGQANYARENLNNSINRDIEAQKNDQSKSLNLWKINRENMNSDAEANLATRNQLLSAVQAKALMYTASSNSAQAKFKGDQLVNQIEQEKIQNRLQLGLLNQGSQTANGTGFSQADPASLVPSLVPKEHQEKALAEIGTAQNASANETDLLAQFDQAAKDVRFVTGGHPLYSTIVTPPSIKRMQALEDPLIHDQVGRVNEFEKKDLGDLKPQAFDNDETIASKRLGYQQFIERKKSAPTAKAYGINLANFATTSSDPRAKLTAQTVPLYNEAQRRLKVDPNDPTGHAALKKLGIE